MKNWYRVWITPHFRGGAAFPETDYLQASSQEEALAIIGERGNCKYGHLEGGFSFNAEHILNPPKEWILEELGRVNKAIRSQTLWLGELTEMLRLLPPETP